MSMSTEYKRHQGIFREVALHIHNRGWELNLCTYNEWEAIRIDQPGCVEACRLMLEKWAANFQGSPGAALRKLEGALISMGNRLVADMVRRYVAANNLAETGEEVEKRINQQREKEAKTVSDDVKEAIKTLEKLKKEIACENEKLYALKNSVAERQKIVADLEQTAKEMRNTKPPMTPATTSHKLSEQQLAHYIPPQWIFKTIPLIIEQYSLSEFGLLFGLCNGEIQCIEADERDLRERFYTVLTKAQQRQRLTMRKFLNTVDSVLAERVLKTWETFPTSDIKRY